MALQTFSVTAESVRKHHFPQADAFSTTSRPSEATVLEAIDEEAGKLAGKLNTEGVTVADDATKAAFVSCRAQLRMMVALRIARDMTGVDPELSRAWKKEVIEWFLALEESNADALGDGASNATELEPDGPTDHIQTLNLDTGNDDDASDLIPVLRRKDDL
ncbi:MAG: hypothetical protein JNM17_04100 [Archangium sp.]|nr:hypothetical protein [Archangium sp.]